MKLHAWDEVIRNADAVIARGGTVFQQFVCHHCGAKQTMETPNTFYRTGLCEECNLVTDIERDGQNFMAVLGHRGET